MLLNFSNLKFNMRGLLINSIITKKKINKYRLSYKFFRIKKFNTSREI